MRLLEKRGQSMRYSSLKTMDDDNRPGIETNIGKASTEEWRWWCALVTPAHGWCPWEGKWSPPWTIAYRGIPRLRVTADIVNDIDPGICTPPSSHQAIKFLSKFASAYNLDGQSSLALAMVLTLPLLNESRSSVNLPAISTFTGPSVNMAPTPNIYKDFDNIPYYMSLSSNNNFLAAALWGIFWEPGIDCNLVSGWTEAIAQIATDCMERDNLELFAHIFALRRPNIAPLWYGVLAYGRRTVIFNSIIQFLKTLTLPLSISFRPMAEVAAWTGSPQSFMDVCGSGPYLLEDQVSREDVWRLRYECWNAELEDDTFESMPLCPWPPFGTMPDNETELPVRHHLQCPRHQWAYSHWTWISDNGQPLVDSGFCSDKDVSVLHSIPLQEFVCDKESVPMTRISVAASRQATGDIFWWGASSMEPSGRAIYAHPWVQALDGLSFVESQHVSEETTETDHTYKDDDEQRISDWIATLELCQECPSPDVATLEV